MGILPGTTAWPETIEMVDENERMNFERAGGMKGKQIRQFLIRET